jgi:hypothetical protein
MLRGDVGHSTMNYKWPTSVTTLFIVGLVHHYVDDCCSIVVWLSIVVRLLFDCCLTVVRLLFDRCSIVVWLLFDCCSTFDCCLISEVFDCLIVVDCCSIVVRLLFDCCTIVVWLLYDCCRLLFDCWAPTCPHVHFQKWTGEQIAKPVHTSSTPLSTFFRAVDRKKKWEEKG